MHTGLFFGKRLGGKSKLLFKTTTKCNDGHDGDFEMR